MFKDLKSGKLSSHLRDLSRGKDIDAEALSNFLWFGYLPGDKTLFKDILFVPSGASEVCTLEAIRRCQKEPLKDDKEILVKQGVQAWEAAVMNTLSAQPGQLVVPLSGGMDSRAILGELLRHFDAKSISTYTFGTPGTLDYDIGHQVARLMKTKHTSYDLQEYIFTQQRMEERAYLSNGDTDLFTQGPLDCLARDFSSTDAVFWSGFMGDPTTGSHIPNTALRKRWGTKYCLHKERYSQNVDLAEFLVGLPRVESNIDLPEESADSQLYPEELWDFQNRQMRYVISQVLPDGFTYALPFIREEWLRFTLNLPQHWRRGQKLYKLMLSRAYPKLFSLPVKNTMGLPLQSSPLRQLLVRAGARTKKLLCAALRRPFFNKGINYIDFGAAIRSREDVRSVVRENITDLADRDLIRRDKIDAIWHSHQNMKADYSRALTLLASLEIILKVYKD